MEERKQYVVDIEKFVYTNSLGNKFSLDVKLYITEVNGCWDVWVGADNYGYRESLFGLPTDTTTLEEAIKYGKNSYYEYGSFQEYVLETE